LSEFREKFTTDVMYVSESIGYPRDTLNTSGLSIYLFLVPSDEALYIAFFDVSGGANLEAKSLADFSEKCCVPLGVHLVFKEEYESTTLIDLVDIRLRSEPHDEERYNSEMFA
jgi:hypothetical protein